jgi:hypothetical protein
MGNENIVQLLKAHTGKNPVGLLLAATRAPVQGKIVGREGELWQVDLLGRADLCGPTGGILHVPTEFIVGVVVPKPPETNQP